MPKKPAGPVNTRNHNTNPTIERANKDDRFQPARIYESSFNKDYSQPPTILDIIASKYPQNQHPEHGGARGITHPALTASARLGSSGVEGRGGSIPAGPTAPAFTPAVADLSKDPYIPAYDTLLQFVKDSAAARNPQFDATKKTFQNQQATSDKGLRDSYLGSRSGADASATALGVDPLAVSAARDLQMRKNQENSDQSLADNLAWLDKSKMLEGQMLNTDMVGFAHDKAEKSAGWQAEEQRRIEDQNLKALQDMVDAVKAANSGGGGGGGGHGGGRKKGGGGSKSSSGDVNSTATETSTLQFGGADKAYYDELVAGGHKEAAALFLNQHLLNSNVKEVADTQKRVNDLTSQSTVNGKKVNAPSKYMKPAANTKKYQSKKYTTAENAATQLPDFSRILAGMLGFSGIMGSPKVTTSVKNTAKGKIS